MGLDSDRDGRAFVAFDFDQDGDLDLVVKNRNTPQLALLRNDSQNQNHGIAFKLIGRQSNRDAVGAVLRITTGQGVRTKYVQMGSGFLSQSSLQVYFGLGSDTQVREVSVTWPSGRQDRFERLPADQLIILREGEAEFQRQAFVSAAKSFPVTVHREPQRQEKTRRETAGDWLVEPVPVPALAGKDLRGNEVTLAHWRGRPLLLNFWATWCVPCQKELSLWREAYDKFRAAGAEIIAVSVDEPGTEQVVRQFAADQGLQFPVLLPTAASVHVYNIFHRNLLRRPRNLQIPTTLLINARGQVVKVYRGSTHPAELLNDLRKLPDTPEQLMAMALPYRGRQIHPRNSRDYVALAFSFLNAGVAEAGQPYLPLATALLRDTSRTHPDNKMVQLYLGVASLASGQMQQAQAALEKAIKLDPAFADAYFNLAVAYSGLGQPQEAIAALEKTVQLDPGFADAYFNLAIVYGGLGQHEKALAALERRSELAPDDAETHNQMGVFQVDLGALEDAIGSFERAAQIQPDNVEPLRNLGIVYYRKGLLLLAEETLEKAQRLAPNDSDTLVALAVTYFQRGKSDEARLLLEKLLDASPEEERARQLLEEIRRLTRTGRP